MRRVKGSGRKGQGLGIWAVGLDRAVAVTGRGGGSGIGCC